MKILHVLGGTGRILTNPDYQALSGISTSALHIAAYQAIQGHSVSVLGFSDPFPPGKSVWRGVSIYAIRRWSCLKISNFDFSRFFPMLLQTLSHQPFDILHVHMALGLLYLPGCLVRIFHLHGLHPIKAKNFMRSLGHADAVVCCSDYIRRQFLSEANYPSTQTFVIHNGAESEPIKADQNKRLFSEHDLNKEGCTILFVGALVPEKGVDILLESLRLVQDLDINTIIAGGSNLWVSGEKHSNYERKLRFLASDLNVRFLGLVSPAIIKELYQFCDILVLPSIWQEPHPLVILDAMANGKAVVASNVGGIPEQVIDSETGILVPPGDPIALATAIRNLVTNPSLREDMGNSAKLQVSKFSWNVAVNELHLIYKDLLNRK